MGECLLRFVEQPRVLQRDADVGGDRRQQALIVRAVDAFLVRALHADHAQARATHRNGHAKVRQRLFADDLGAQLESAPVGLVVDDQRLARLDDPAGEPFAERDRLEVVAVLVREVDDAGIGVVQRDVGHIGVEHRPDLLAHQVEERRQLELAAELLRHRVDGGELRRALLGLREQPRVLDRHRGLQRQADQEVQVTVAERHAARPPHGHHALDLAAGEQRRDHQAFVLLLVRAGYLDAAWV